MDKSSNKSQRTLMNEEEKVIFDTIQRICKKGFPLLRSDIAGAVGIFVHKSPEEWSLLLNYEIVGLFVSSLVCS